jgi:prepilin-type N-terminal cleavage/methylation domain-containing protein/prepilin-type processing-associated H-X9-DG protein
MRKRAFTLIELLVVIAIIAILAAILFPVFASAKAAAKASASLSNVKQITLAALMYAGDYDDYLVQVGVWNSTDPDAFNFGVSSWASWSLLIDPYQKNVHLNGSPLAGPLVRGSEVARRVATRLQNYGYNYTYLSPSICCTWPTPITSIASTTVNKPAQNVMFVESVSRDGTIPPSAVWYYPPGPPSWTTTGTVEAPDCWTVPDVWCTDGWGGTSQSFWFTVITSEEEGKYTGRNAFRTAKKTQVAFVDGHAQAQQQGRLAQGTNWQRNILVSTVVNLHNNQYQWDTRD